MTTSKTTQSEQIGKSHIELSKEGVLRENAYLWDMVRRKDLKIAILEKALYDVSNPETNKPHSL